MNLKLFYCIFLVAIAHVSPLAIAETTRIGNFTFNVADGLQLERVAEESLIQWPIAATYHPSGDLLILECHWNRESVQKQLESKPHKIVRLSDTNGDRKYDKRTVIADGLGFPEGIMVLGNDLLVTAPPQILRLVDKDNDGFFESRDVWFDGATLTHCANDLHGPMMGPDGWVYWTKGAFAEQNHDLLRRNDKSEGVFAPSKAAHIYRRHPSGGPIERLMSGGMDNPSDLTFSPEGEIFFCSTFLHNPGNGLRDGIAHSPRGGLFGKQQQAIDGHRTTGPLLQPIANLGPAAPASVNYLRSNRIPNETAFGKSDKVVDDNDRFLVSAQFNLQKVGLHRLIPVGSSFETENHDLVTADRIDFHPVDILEESDGSLLVFDTGGWYDLCCPSSGSDQSIAKGGIYRLKANKPSSEKLALSLDDLKLDVAKHQALNASEKSDVRKRSMWRIATELTSSPGDASLRDLVMSLLADKDSTIQQTAAHIVGLNRWANSRERLEHVLLSQSPATVRAAIESLGVVGDKQSVVPILKALKRFPGDRYIVHSTIFAMMEIGAIDEMVRIAKATSDDHERYAAVYALNEVRKLPDDILPLLVQCLTSSKADMRDLALKCLTSRPHGIAMCVPFLKQAWESENDSELLAGKSIVQLGLNNEALHGMVTGWIRSGPKLSGSRMDWLVDCLQRTSAEIPNDWAIALADWIDETKDNESLVKIANSIRSAKFASANRELIAKSLRHRAEGLIDCPQVAMAALAACPMISLPLTDRCSSLIAEQLVVPEGSNVALAELALARSTLTKESAEKFLANLAQIPPLHLQSAIDAMLRCENDSVDSTLLEKLPSVPAAKTLATERILTSLGKRPDSIKKQWKAMMETVMRPPEDIAQSLDAWLDRLPKGDPAHGYQVFRSTKAACSSCHQIGYIGGRLGPELSRIGKTRTRRDLVEAVVFPSLRMAQGYYPVRIRTVHDEVFNGLVSKQTESYVELVCGVDKVCRIEKQDISEQSDSKLSVMPTGLDQQLTLSEFADLVAFLESKNK